MSCCGELCAPSGSPAEVTWPQPLTSACHELCVTSCHDSKAVIYPPPVVLTFPGPILSSCPQESMVGSCSPLQAGRAFGPAGSLGYRGYGSAVGLRGSILFGGSNGAGGAWNYGRSYSPGCPSLGRGNCSPA
ncbi:KRFJ protein, partial [Atrichornis clamosus]|nr:KRFJ protein [Atrichornis clamosus]